jgi:hypothetical protein
MSEEKRKKAKAVATSVALMMVLAVGSVCEIAFAQNAIPIDYFTKEEREGYASRYVRSIVESPNRTRCIDNYRMDPFLFRALCDRLRPTLKTTKMLTVEVMVAIYLDWVGHHPTYRKQKETFKISHGSIKKAKSRVRLAILREMHPDYVKGTADDIPNFVDSPQFKHFQGVYGCIDGSHVPIEVESSEKENWINRKKFVSTNALLISDVNSNLVFDYAMFGAEGCGSDSLVLRYAMSKDLTFLEDGFLIGDAGYALSPRLLTPYRGVRYHLKEFHSSPLGRPRNYKELYNLRHASLRNQVERAFGVMKRRFRILREPIVVASYTDMWRTHLSCVVLHNFIRVENAKSDQQFEAGLRAELNEANRVRELVPCQKDSKAGNLKRDIIAKKMWNDYCVTHPEYTPVAVPIAVV